MASLKTLIIFSLLYSKQIFAVELNEVYLPTRAIGMGNASTALANDRDAAFENPAGYKRTKTERKKGYINSISVPNLTVGLNSQASKFRQNLTKYQSQAAEDLIDKSQEISDQTFWGYVASFPAVYFNLTQTLPALGGAYSVTQSKATVDSENPEQVNLSVVSDFGFVAGLNFTSRLNFLSFGVQARPVTRFSYEDKVPTSTLTSKTAYKSLVNNAKVYGNKMSTVAIDAGLLLTIPDFWLPTIGIAAYNLPLACKNDYHNPYSKKREKICGSKYVGTIANDDALTTLDPTDIRLGFSVTPRFSNNYGLRIALDMHHLYLPISTETYAGTPGIEFQKLLHAGLEFFIGNPMLVSPFSLRTGVNQGFLTAGLSARVGALLLEAATYGADVSSTSTSKQDRRYLASVNLEF